MTSADQATTGGANGSAALVFFGAASAPFTWFLGVHILIFHGVAAVALALLCGRRFARNVPLYAPFGVWAPFAYASIGSVSLVVAAGDAQMGRLLGAAYNTSIWIMGASVALVVANASWRTARAHLTHFAVLFASLVGVCSVAALVLWSEGHRFVTVASPMWPIVKAFGPYPLLEASTTTTILRQDWLFGSPQPRISALAVYPTALAATLFFVIPALAFMRPVNALGRLAQAILLGLAFLAFAMALSRAAVVALLIGSSATFLLLVRRNGLFLVLAVLMLLAILPALIVTADWLASARGYSTLSRFTVYFLGLDIALADNWWLGIGVKPRVDDFKIPIGSHSTYVGALVKSGVLGLSLIALWQAHVAATCVVALRNAQDAEQRRLLAVIGPALFAIPLWMATEDLDAPQCVAFLYFLAIGALYSAARELTQQRQRHPRFYAPPSPVIALRGS